MSFENSLFEKYFSNQVSESYLIEKLEIDNKDFLDNLYEEVVCVIEKKDAQRLEYLIYALLMWEMQESNTIILLKEKFLDCLNNALLLEWHKQHEIIVDLLQKMPDEKSITYLYRAIYLKLLYLEWDENYSFQKKCVRVIAKIGGEEAIKCLEALCKEENEIIRELAQRKIEQARVEK